MPPQRDSNQVLQSVSALSCKQTVASTVTMKGKQEDKENDVPVTDFDQQVSQQLTSRSRASGRQAKSKQTLMNKKLVSGSERQPVEVSDGPAEIDEENKKEAPRRNTSKSSRQRTVRSKSSRSRGARSRSSSRSVSSKRLALPAKRAVVVHGNNDDVKRQYQPNLSCALSTSLLVDQSIEEELSINEASQPIVPQQAATPIKEKTAAEKISDFHALV